MKLNAIWVQASSSLRASCSCSSMSLRSVEPLSWLKSKRQKGAEMTSSPWNVTPREAQVCPRLLHAALQCRKQICILRRVQMSLKCLWNVSEMSLKFWHLRNKSTASRRFAALRRRSKTCCSKLRNHEESACEKLDLEMCTMPCRSADHWDFHLSAKGASIDPWHGPQALRAAGSEGRRLCVFMISTSNVFMELHQKLKQSSTLQSCRGSDANKINMNFKSFWKRLNQAGNGSSYCQSSYAFRVSLRGCQFTTSGLETLHGGRIRLLCPPISLQIRQSLVESLIHLSYTQLQRTNLSKTFKHLILTGSHFWYFCQNMLHCNGICSVLHMNSS